MHNPINAEWFILRCYDGNDGGWYDVTKELRKEDVELRYNKCTAKGTKFTSYEDDLFYKIFPVNTTMFHD